MSADVHYLLAVLSLGKLPSICISLPTTLKWEESGEPPHGIIVRINRLNLQDATAMPGS